MDSVSSDRHAADGDGLKGDGTTLMACKLVLCHGFPSGDEIAGRTLHNAADFILCGRAMAVTQASWDRGCGLPVLPATSFREFNPYLDRLFGVKLYTSAIFYDV
jgi:hypothetical protein